MSKNFIKHVSPSPETPKYAPELAFTSSSGISILAAPFRISTRFNGGVVSISEFSGFEIFSYAYFMSDNVKSEKLIFVNGAKSTIAFE